MKRCEMCHDAPTRTARSHWCEECHQIRRAVQLKINNLKWKLRVADGKAGHHVKYGDKPTLWAQVHPRKAIRQAKSYPNAWEVLKVLRSA